jgi:multimeric flavodoxin WrbA
MVKLLGVSASTRVWGNCEAAAKSILVAGRDAGAEIDFIRLTDFNLEPCRGCFRCLARGKHCPTEDDLYRLLGEFQQADAVILAAPVYFLSPPAALVGLMDRLLTMGSLKGRRKTGRPAVTVTIMGNHKWRGVAEPLVNMTVSLLGFDIAESMSLVSEGPGEILSREGVVGRFGEIGRSLALGEPLRAEAREGICPVCRADFFRIEAGRVICPVCGAAGGLGNRR